MKEHPAADADFFFSFCRLCTRMHIVIIKPGFVILFHIPQNQVSMKPAFMALRA
jgi:hypothetical protein